MRNLLTAIGLICDIVGAFLIFLYGLPPDIRRDGASVIVCSTEATESEQKTARRYDMLSRLGCIALLLGFFLQLIAVVLAMIE